MFHYSQRESGYYPAGAEFDPRAPWNQSDPVMEQCDVCCGTGIIYYDSLDNEITKERYDSLTDDERYSDVCYKCDGEGEVEIIEPDYDDYNE